MVFLLLLMIYIWYGNVEIDVDNTEIYSERIPDLFDGFCIAELADIHGREFGENNEKLIKKVREIKPDIITINGDMLDEDSDAAMVKRLIPGLVEIAPVFYVTGNHEWSLGNETVTELKEQLTSLGVTVLSNEFVLLKQGGEQIVLAGVDDPNGPYDMKTPEELTSEIRAELGDPYIVMLAHRNGQLDTWAELGIDLVLVGHGHGGIVRLPFVGGVFGTDRNLFPDYTSGLYEKDGTKMIVSRGLGNEVINFRVFNPPNIQVAVLKSGIKD